MVAINESVTCIFFLLKISLKVSVNKKIEKHKLTRERMRAFGQVLKQQRTILSQHVGFQRQQTVLTHESRAQVGDGGSLERILLLRSQGLRDVAGFPADEGFLDGRVGVRSLHSAVRAAGLCHCHISTCVTKDAIRNANKFLGCGTSTTRACLTTATKNWDLGTYHHLFWPYCHFSCVSIPFSRRSEDELGRSEAQQEVHLPHSQGFLFFQPLPTCTLRFCHINPSTKHWEGRGKGERYVPPPPQPTTG